MHVPFVSRGEVAFLSGAGLFSGVDGVGLVDPDAPREGLRQEPGLPAASAGSNREPMEVVLLGSFSGAYPSILGNDHSFTGSWSLQENLSCWCTPRVAQGLGFQSQRTPSSPPRLVF